MNSTSAPPNHPSSLFPQITACKTMRELHQVHAHFIKTRQIHDQVATIEILRFYALSAHHLRNIQCSRSVFNQMEQPNCFSWNTIKSSVNEHQLEHQLEALVLFSKMVGGGGGFVGPNRFTCPSVLKACAEMGSLEVGKCVHGMVVKFGLESDVFVVSNLVRMYAMCEVMEDANLLFYRSFDGNVVLRNVIVGYVSW